MIHPDRNIMTAALLLNAIATDVEKARRHLRAEARLLDGTPTSTSGADNNGSRGERTISVAYTDEHGEEQTDQVPVTIVEAAAINRQRIDEIQDDLEAHVRGIVTMANEIARTTQRILATRIEVPRCTSKGRDGAIEWGDPTCFRVPSRGPLCDACAKREYRWRIARGLPPRTNTVFSADTGAA